MSANTVNEAQLRQLLESGATVLVDYWAPWCTYCRRIGPAFDLIARQYSDRLTAVKVNIDDNGDLARSEKIGVIPTLVLYRDGRATASVTAPDSKAAIESFLREALAVRREEP